MQAPTRAPGKQTRSVKKPGPGQKPDRPGMALVQFWLPVQTTRRYVSTESAE